MQGSYLEVTFRQGKALAAYYYLPRAEGRKSVRTERSGAGLLVDYDREGRPIGIEITAPAMATLPAMNSLLRKLGLRPLRRVDLAPLQAT